MSMTICGGCDAPIDSDDDPDCFVEVGNMRRLHQTIIRCETCRDQMQAELEREEDAASRCQAEAESRQ
jgi:hypothetical protein